MKNLENETVRKRYLAPDILLIFDYVDMIEASGLIGDPYIDDGNDILPPGLN